MYLFDAVTRRPTLINNAPVWIFHQYGGRVAHAIGESLENQLSDEERLIHWALQFCKSDMISLDIGAHSGTYTLNMVRHSKIVHAFEPQRKQFYDLCGSVALSNYHNHVICHHCGLGSEDQRGQQKLRVTSEDGGGSSLHVVHTTLPLLNEEIVTVNTLDDYKSELMDNVGFIKIDVEGNEGYVIKGGKQVISSCYPTILFERNEKDVDLCRLMTSEIESLGYGIVDITGYSHMKLAVKR